MARQDLSTPRQSRGIGVHYDSDAFGRFSEAVARYLGTARFLVWQTGVIVVWIAWNLIMPKSLQFDPYGRGLVLLTLVLSLQASYAAPLILLAQNRQEERDRRQSESDRELNARTQADTEFLAREIASVRLAMGDVATTDDLRHHLEKLTDAVEKMARRLDQLEGLDGFEKVVLDEVRDDGDDPSGLSHAG
ncbi:MAG: DUF1003 domain-containing protein [Ilumatobacteraceae bacterium]